MEEEQFARRVAATDTERDLALAQSHQIEEHEQQMREANERLLIASLHSQTLAEAAEQANARKDEFLAMLSHELRNPLAPIRNAAAILGRMADAEPRLRWVHGVIERQCEQMMRLLDDLLEATRVRTGKIVLSKRPVIVREFIEHAIETCRPLTVARGQQLSVELPADPIYVDGDSVRLAQVFGNLLSNAIKYTPEGGAITVRAEATETALVVRVQDNGSGIAPVALPHVFDLFMQEQRSLDRAQGGLGIGLTVVRELVELHGGTVLAASGGVGRGSEFVVTLPRLQQVPAGTEVHAEPPSTGTRLACLRIAVIEDNVDANESLVALLRMEGHEVISAFDGISGLNLVRAQHPQILLCDIGLPGMNGLQVARQLREEMQEELPLMVAITGYGQAADRERSLSAGFKGHLTKPIDIVELLTLIDRQVDRRAAGLQ